MPVHQVIALLRSWAAIDPRLVVLPFAHTGNHREPPRRQVYPGWGLDNVFRSNEMTVNGPGYGIFVQSKHLQTVVYCGNEVTAAAIIVTGVHEAPSSAGAGRGLLAGRRRSSAFPGR